MRSSEVGEYGVFEEVGVGSVMLGVVLGVVFMVCRFAYISVLVSVDFLFVYKRY